MVQTTSNRQRFCITCARGHELQQKRRHRLDHIEEARAYDRRHDRERAEERKAASRKRYAEHPERAQERRRTHPGRAAAATARYVATHPGTVAARNATRNARKCGVPGEFAWQEWQQVIKLYGGRCVYCGCTPDKLTVDHDIPLSRGGSNWLDNVVPACRPCNRAKHAMTGAEYRMWLDLNEPPALDAAA
jgi:5-methylcytosine-specific restriction endonuclease McrA